MSVFDESCSTAALEKGLRVEDDRDREFSEAPSAASLRGPGDAPRMIIVEDAPLIALDLAETMKDLGFDIQATAFTHEQALAEIERSTPQFAVVDLHLGVDEDDSRRGEALLSLLDERGCRCLVFSGDDEACRRVAERFPHFSVIGKPAQPAKLAREVQRLRQLGSS